jgi:hypothetical protein
MASLKEPDLRSNPIAVRRSMHGMSGSLCAGGSCTVADRYLARQVRALSSPMEGAARLASHVSEDAITPPAQLIFAFVFSKWIVCNCKLQQLVSL